MDCTGSMKPYIREASNKVKNAIDRVKAYFDKKFQIRVGFVGYRDYKDIGADVDHMDVMDFTEDVDAIKAKISQTRAHGGGSDGPEDLCGAFDYALRNLSF